MTLPPKRAGLIFPVRPAPPTQPTEVGVFVPPEAVFSGVKGTEQELLGCLAELSRDDTLFHAARLNTLISGPEDFDVRGRQQRALSWVCTPEQIGRINAFIRSRGNTAGPTTIFFRGQILELVRWVARYSKNKPGDGNTFEDPRKREAFVKALLIASALWGSRVFRDTLSGGSSISETRLRAIGSMRKGVEESNLGPHLGVALARGRAIFAGHLPTRSPQFGKLFLEATGLTLDQYRACVASLSIYTIFNRKEGPMFVTHSVANATALKDVFPRYFEQEGQSAEQLAHSLWHDFKTNGYRALRERPIFVAADGRGIILDPTFYAEKVSIAPFFYALRLLRGGKANTFFADFGLAFQDYITAMLRRMYPIGAGLFDRLALGWLGSDAKGKGFEIDAALLDVSAAAVFEIKAAWLREDAIANDTHEVLIDHIREKYGVSPKKGERDKGVAQLARSIGAVVRAEWLGPNNAFMGVNRLHPVLLVHDTRMDTPALGQFLDGEFRRLLGPVPEGKTVAPLTVMTVQDIEGLESSVEAFTLIDLLDAYAAACPDRLRSLHNFMAFSDYGRKIVPSRFLMENAEEVLQVLQRELSESS